MKRILLLLTVITLSLSAFAKAPETAAFTLSPKMTCSNCENKIKSNLRFEKGVKDIKTSIPDQTVSISFDPEKTSAEKLIAAFKKIGYTAKIVAPEARTKEDRPSSK